MIQSNDDRKKKKQLFAQDSFFTFLIFRMYYTYFIALIVEQICFENSTYHVMQSNFLIQNFPFKICKTIFIN